MAPMTLRKLGEHGPEVPLLGLGCMGMSGMYGPSDRAEAQATIHAALDAGIRLLDTGDFYGMGHNELLIAEAIRDRPREDFLVSVKFGAQRSPDGSWLGYDARPATVAQVAIAWVLSRGDDIVPLVGARTRERLEEALGAPGVELSDDDVARLERAVPHEAVAGDRYPEQQMAMLDSERV
jgi:aryl-alcohol dehydrogenase-like predicted oxidoreductase